MPVSIFPIGTDQLINGNGIIAPATIPSVVLPATILSDNILRAFRTPVVPRAITAQTLAAGASLEIIAAVAAESYIISLLSVEISVAGILEFDENSTTVLALHLPANVTNFIPIPAPGMASSAVNKSFSVKNTQGVSVVFNINIIWTYA